MSNICEKPVCPDNISIYIASLPECVDNGQSIYCSWKIDNNISDPSQTGVEYSINDKSFVNINGPYLSNAILSTYSHNISFLAPNYECTLFVRCYAVINGTYYYSNISSLKIGNCISLLIDPVIPVKRCGCNVDTSNYNLYVKKSGVPIVVSSGIAIYFKYNSVCWYIDYECYNNAETLENDSLDVILNSVNSEYNSCVECCQPVSDCDFVGCFETGSINFSQVYDIANSHYVVFAFYSMIDKTEVGSDKYNQFIVSDTDTGDVLFNSGCSTADNWYTTLIENLENINRMTITVVSICDDGIYNNEWRFRSGCYDALANPGPIVGPSPGGISGSGSSGYPGEENTNTIVTSDGGGTEDIGATITPSPTVTVSPSSMPSPYVEPGPTVSPSPSVTSTNLVSPSLYPSPGDTGFVSPGPSSNNIKIKNEDTIITSSFQINNVGPGVGPNMVINEGGASPGVGPIPPP